MWDTKCPNKIQLACTHTLRYTDTDTSAVARGKRQVVVWNSHAKSIVLAQGVIGGPKRPSVQGQHIAAGNRPVIQRSLGVVSWHRSNCPMADVMAPPGKSIIPQQQIYSRRQGQVRHQVFFWWGYETTNGYEITGLDQCLVYCFYSTL